MKPRLKTSIQHSESGLASMTVSIFIMIIVGLIVIASLTLVRRNQRQALDRQLSTQAFYAAESGVNDAIKAIKNGYKGYGVQDAGTGNKTSCGPDSDSTSPLSLTNTNNQINGSQAGYTCLLIDKTAPNLIYQSVSLNAPVVADINTGSNISSIRIFWQNSDDSTFAWDNYPESGTAFYPKFPPSSGWKTSGGLPFTGILRLAMTDLSGGYGNSALNNNTYTAFLYPVQNDGSSTTICGKPANSVGTTDFIASGSSFGSCQGINVQGQIVKASCSISSPILKCGMTINLPGNSKHYLLRLASIYTNSHVYIDAHSAQNGGGSTLPIQNVQAIIDSTGQAQDVLRRVQVRVALTNTPSMQAPPFAVQASTGLCKNLYVETSTYTIVDFNGDTLCEW